MCELQPEVLDGRRATDLVSSRRDQPTPWRRLALDFLVLCRNKRSGAPDDVVEKSRSEMLIDALKLDFQMKKWRFGLERLEAMERGHPVKRAKMDNQEGLEDVKRATKALEQAKAERRAYDRCVALQVVIKPGRWIHLHWCNACAPIYCGLL